MYKCLLHWQDTVSRHLHERCRVCISWLPVLCRADCQLDTPRMQCPNRTPPESVRHLKRLSAPSLKLGALSLWSPPETDTHVCVSLCVCSLLCVCTLDGLNAEHKFWVWVTILGRMSRHVALCNRLLNNFHIHIHIPQYFHSITWY